MSSKELINVGKISGVFGVKGWVKVFSFTEPRDNIISYSPWLLKKGSEEKSIAVVDGQLQGKTVVAQLDGIADRDHAANLMGWEVFIKAEQLPEPSDDEYYWSQLVGLNVETTGGVQLGIIDGLMETGANDVILIKGDRERAIPFLLDQTIVTIDLSAGKMIVDWDPEF
ncbi:MAG: ribosome maturation factor RimM [Methylococcales bacterium]|nr:ribosome maturation factor RimM [Methylococcaceae bacterium]